MEVIPSPADPDSVLVIVRLDSARYPALPEPPSQFDTFSIKALLAQVPGGDISRAYKLLHQGGVAGQPGRRSVAYRPVTILTGRCDTFIPAGQQELLRAQFSDVRVTDGDHFLPLLRPGAVAEIIAATFAATSATAGSQGAGAS